MSSGFGFGGDVFFSVFPILFTVVAVLVIGAFVFVLVKMIARSVRNSNSPVLSVEASVATKRTEVSGGSGDTSASTWHYATFEVASGDRMELPVTGEQYGMLAEGDAGMLTFQGTRFLRFERRITETR